MVSSNVQVVASRGSDECKRLFTDVASLQTDTAWGSWIGVTMVRSFWGPISGRGRSADAVEGLCEAVEGRVTSTVDLAALKPRCDSGSTPGQRHVVSLVLDQRGDLDEI